VLNIVGAPGAGKSALIAKLVSSDALANSATLVHFSQLSAASLPGAIRSLAFSISEHSKQARCLLWILHGLHG
jgi:hypothetical protein